MSKKSIIYIIISILIIIIMFVVFIIKYKDKKENNQNDIQYVNEAGAEDDSRKINELEIRILGMNKEISEKINEKKLLYLIKEYLYKNGLINCDKVQYMLHDIKDDIMTIKFKLNDDEETRIIVQINLKNDSDIIIKSIN